MKKIIFTRPDGGLSVVHPVRNTIGETLATDEEIEQRAWNKLPSEAINPRFIDAVPADREYRNAWVANGAAVAVDMPKAREIKREQLRSLRAPKLEALDVEFMRAVETDDKAKQDEVRAQKQALRDVTNNNAIEDASTPVELKAFLPDILK